MLSDDVFRSRLLATIESLRYFVPSVADVAQSEEQGDSSYWKLSILPNTDGACPVELILHSTQRYDVMIADEAYEDREIISLDHFLPLLEAISEGHVKERTYYSLATGAKLARTTFVRYRFGVWQAGSGPDGIQVENESVRWEDRHYLPYRR
jgi:hypothetical protein